MQLRIEAASPCPPQRFPWLGTQALLAAAVSLTTTGAEHESTSARLCPTRPQPLQRGPPRGFPPAADASPPLELRRLRASGRDAPRDIGRTPARTFLPAVGHGGAARCPPAQCARRPAPPPSRVLPAFPTPLPPALPQRRAAPRRDL